jgi:hypothetical protein
MIVIHYLTYHHHHLRCFHYLHHHHLRCFHYLHHHHLRCFHYLHHHHLFIISCSLYMEYPQKHEHLELYDINSKEHFVIQSVYSQDEQSDSESHRILSRFDRNLQEFRRNPTAKIPVESDCWI